MRPSAGPDRLGRLSGGLGACRTRGNNARGLPVDKTRSPALWRAPQPSRFRLTGLPAVALVVALLVTPEGVVAIGEAEALALLVAALLGWKSRNHLLTVTVAMAVFWIVRVLLDAPA